MTSLIDRLVSLILLVLCHKACMLTAFRICRSSFSSRFRPSFFSSVLSIKRLIHHTCIAHHKALISKCTCISTAHQAKLRNVDRTSDTVMVHRWLWWLLCLRTMSLLSSCRTCGQLRTHMGLRRRSRQIESLTEGFVPVQSPVVRWVHINCEAAQHLVNLLLDGCFVYVGLHRV